MKHFLFAAACVALFSAVACKANYDKTKSGLVYRIVSSKGGAPVKVGDFVKFNVEFRMSTPKDTVLNTTYGKFPGYARVDSGAQTTYSFFEVMPHCKVGDSVEFSISVDTLEKRHMIPGYNNIFVKNGVIKGRLTILKAFDKEELVKTDYEAETEKIKSVEVAALQKYLDKNNIKATKTKNGVFVEILQPGDAAVKADSGKQVSIMYRGYLADDPSKKAFDTNMDTSHHHTEPYDVVVGQGRVIPGWEEALPYFTKGSKGRIYIPSSMGYGMRGSGEIPPNANLIFDIEVKDVKDAPPQPQGGMNGMTPEQMQQMQQMMQQRQQQQQNGGTPPQK